jgi:hypothetical protein
MRLLRRRILQSLAAVLATVSTGAQAVPIGTAEPAAAPASTDSFRVLLDTLIPADDTPAASAFGIDRALLAMAARSDDYRRLLEDGVQWLDRAARASGARSFAVASEQRRVDIVRQAEGSATNTLPRRFFERVKADAMRVYYAEPAAWQLLGYTGPPQPHGFPDYEEPPARRP